MRVQYTVNKANQVTEVYNPDHSPVRPGQSWVTNIRYRAHGGRDEWTFGNGLREKIEYNTRMQAARITTTDPHITDRDTRMLEFQLDYGPALGNNGNIRGLGELWRDRDTGTLISQLKQFDYDGLNRLQGARADYGPSPWSLLYRYDRFGNRLEQIRLAGDTARVPDVRMTMENQDRMVTNRIAVFSINGEARRPRYDPAGNLTSDGERQFRFDAENQLYQVDDGLAEYRYNASHQRVYKKVGECETRFVYGLNGKLLSEVSRGACP